MLARDRAQLNNAKLDASRYEELVKKGYVAQAQYDQFRTTAEALEGTVKADAASVENAKIQLSYSCGVSNTSLQKSRRKRRGINPEKD